MNRGKIDAKKPGKEISTKGAIKIIGKAMAAGLAAGIALIAVTDKAMNKAFPQDTEEEAAGEEE